jgi:hypothetical protein
MRERLKTLSLVSFAAVLVLAFFTLGFSRGQQGMMHRRGMMGMMDNMMGQSSQMMNNLDNMMGQACPGYQGMMNMRGMMMHMNNMSQYAKQMMSNLDSMMMNQELMKDKTMKEQADQMQENLRMMSENMQKAMDNMQMMTQRMGELNKK